MTHTGIYLSELLKGFAEVPAQRDQQITGLEVDSRRVKTGDCFIAIAGTTSHGIDYIEEALAAGAVTVLVDPRDAHRLSDEQLRNILFVDQLTRKSGEIAHRFYGQTTALMKTIGVTGTNGKTSVTWFIAQAIDQLVGSGTCGVIGTLGSGLFGEFVSSGLTTPDNIRLHQTLSRLHDQGAQAVAIEASSHGLAQNRLTGVDFDVAVFTNLTRDHLDYHGNMQAYGEAKLELFKSPDLKAAVINFDDPFADRILQAVDSNVQVIGYSLNPYQTGVHVPTIRCCNLEVSVKGLRLTIESSDGQDMLECPVLGRFNASNLLAALGALVACGFHFEEAIQALSKVTGARGRMEVFTSDLQPVVVVDFAHTPDGLIKALETLREICDGQLWCVFGCGGDRDTGKRPLMGAAAEELADRVIITNDNPRSEEPAAIAAAILSGMKHPDTATVILERREAIATSIRQAGPDDIILVAGKGHESWQEIGGQRFAFNDRNVVLNFISQRGQYD